MDVAKKHDTKDIIYKSLISTYNATVGFAISRVLVGPTEHDDDPFDKFDNKIRVGQLSHTILFVEDRKRRKLDEGVEWILIIIPIIFSVAIGVVIFLIGTGMVGGK
jgi:hypothetical protein